LSAVPEAKGIVVFSTGAEETSTMAATGLRLLNPAISVSRSSDTDIVIDGSMNSSEFSDEHGNVRMLVLDEGEYRFRPVV
jgi:hypothetical protein